MSGGTSINSFIDYYFLERLIISGNTRYQNKVKQRMVPSYYDSLGIIFFIERRVLMEIKPKDKFRHFKGNTIEVVCVAKNSETLEDMVVYTHNNEYWVRPIVMFQDKTEVINRPDNVTGQKYRFEKIEEEE